jgi:hypothetical protein
LLEGLAHPFTREFHIADLRIFGILGRKHETSMTANDSEYFDPNLSKKDARTILVTLGILLAAAVGVLVLQSFGYASSLAELWQSGQNIWEEQLSQMLQIVAIWSVVLGVLLAVRAVTTPVTKYGGEFWTAIVTSFPRGVAIPFLFILGAGLILFIPLGLLSLLVPDVYPFATLQFGWLAGAYLVFLWIATGMPSVLARLFQLRKWYDKFLAILLALDLLLDCLQTLESVLKTLLMDSVWQSNNTALLLGLFGSLLVSIAAGVWLLRGRPALTIVFTIVGVYVASVVSGNFSDRLFGWGELPSALLAVVLPLVYLQAAKWILRRDGTAAAGLIAGYLGLLTGLLLDSLLQLRISGHGWISLLWGVIVVLGVGLALGYFLGRRVNRLLSDRLKFQAILLKYMDIGLTVGIMAGMFIGGFLAR